MMQENRLLQAAKEVASELHAGQKDKGGQDYFKGHLTSVAKQGKTWQETFLGYLHDAAEDTPHTEEEVLDMVEKKAGISLAEKDRTRLHKALCLLNRHNFPTREEYIVQLCTDPLAAKVKCHDLTNNMDLSRLPSPTERDYSRLERYKREIAFVKEHIK